jgi:chemosensory pili system protein ChpA (sensor histidine kinase/response regulator)
MLRVPAEMIDQLLRLSAENQIMFGQLRNFIDDAFQQLKEVRAHFEELRGLGGRMEELADVKDLGRTGAPARGDGYDALEMDQYTELHSHSRRMAEITVDAGEASRTIAAGLNHLKEVIDAQSRLSLEAQNLMLQTRMLPAATHLQRWQRCVRQAARLTGKQVGLRLVGGETLVDGTLLNGLLDPLMHLLRNAVDHGIEPAAERAALGKSPEGMIELEFGREGPYINVTCRDDGRGMNLDAIRRQAIARGMLAADRVASEEELHQFVLQPGFSTKQEVSQVSGRGIGMDAVCTSITAQSGSLSLRSEAGRGCTIRIRLPQDLLSIFGLLVRSGRRLVVLATRGVTQVVHPSGYELSGEGPDLRVRMHDQELEAVPLERLMRGADNRRQGERRPRTAILYRTDAGQRAVLVERILASQQFAVKGLGEYIPKLAGIAGATLLGDGTVAPVLDIADLLRQPLQAPVPEETRAAATAAVAPPTALVVDDSMSARRSLAQFMQDAGYQVRQARDGGEALEIIQARCPDILLSDLEMPRINGLELAGRVRADPRTAHVPIILITSRAMSRHQQEARSAGVNAYLTKPFSEEQLLAEIKRLRARGST